LSKITISAHIKNLRRVFIKMHRNLDLTESNSDMIDLVNHADTLAEEIQLIVDKNE